VFTTPLNTSSDELFWKQRKELVMSTVLINGIPSMFARCKVLFELWDITDGKVKSLVRACRREGIYLTRSRVWAFFCYNITVGLATRKRPIDFRHEHQIARSELARKLGKRPTRSEVRRYLYQKSLQKTLEREKQILARENS
jgi:hypothetical protein